MPAHPAFLQRFAADFLAALQRFTRLRFRGAPALPPAGVAPRALEAQWPAVGWIVGMAAALAFAVVGLALRGNAWSPLVAALASTLATAWLTRADSERALAATDRITADLVLAGKTGVLAALAFGSEPGVVAALFAGHVVSRFIALLVVRRLDAVQENGSLRGPALWTLPPLLLLLPAGGAAFLVVPLLACGLATWALLRFWRAREMGAEVRLGASQQVAELAFYFGALLAVR